VIQVVETGWLLDRLGKPGVTVVDPRTRMRYLSGHAPGATWAPVRTAFGTDGRLLGDDALVGWLGRCGIDASGTVVVYADADGQAGAMVAWILEYLGHPDVRFLRTRFERWRDEGGELAYRPGVVTPTDFTASTRPEVRARRDDVAGSSGPLLDTRSPEEFSGERVIGEDAPGHIPGAVNLSYDSFLAGGDNLLADREELTARLAAVDVDLDSPTIVYCRSGIRSAVAWLALHLAGAPVTLYDGSLLDWASDPESPLER
jgi:thiosulfate/3-mercaptopyruvate sulfurtransferase